MRISLLVLLLLVFWAAVSAVESTAFPLRASPSGRHLVDQAGQPFLYHADTPWTLTSRMSPSAVDEYLFVRDAQGYNALQLHVASFHDNDPDWAGNRPFFNGDIAQPNQAYFANVDAVIAKASARGFALMLAPLWLGYGGEDYRPYLNDGNAYDYGRFLASRYSGRANVIWMLGGDNDPGDKISATRLLAAGLSDGGANQLKTYHADNGAGSSSRFFSADAWHTLNSAYTYGPTYMPVISDFNASPARPVYLSESGYEGESNDGGGGSPQRVRRQAWWVMLSGATGHAYGCANVWNFQSDWRSRLDLPGARHLSLMASMLKQRQWWRLVPDQQHQLVTAGYGSWGSLDWATVGRSDDGAFAVVYAPWARDLSIDMGRIGSSVTATWYDPTSGRWIAVAGSPFTGGGVRSLAMPSRNDAGDSDHVLLLERGDAPPPPPPADDIGINLAGGAVTIDGLRWLSFDEARSGGLSIAGGTSWSESYPPISPAADADTRTMLQSVWYRSGPPNGQGFTLSQSIANGDYDVWVWAIENYQSGFRDVDLRLEGRTVATAIGDLPLWNWRRYGPYRTTVADGALTIDALRRSKGDPLLAGVRITRAGSTPPPGDVVPGTWYRLMSRHSGKYLHVVAGSNADGADVVQSSGDSSDAQTWRIDANDDGTWRLTARCSDKSLDVDGGSNANGANVLQWSAHGGANQRWRIAAIGDGFFSVISASSGKCLDVAGWSSADGGDVLQWDYHGGANQQWRLEALGALGFAALETPSSGEEGGLRIFASVFALR